MQVSLNWLKERIDLSKLGPNDILPTKLAELLTARGLEVEEMKSQSKGLEKVVSVKILEKAKHPEADRLSLCKVSLGSGDPLEIVCGAQNMKAGDIVALAQVGADLPNGMKIQAGKIRGVLSNGMLCSTDELGFPQKDGVKSEGILILPEYTKLGQPLAQVLGLDDVTFVLKLTANRSDCLSHYGLAREIGASLGVKPSEPELAQVEWKNSPIDVKLDAGTDSPQFFGVYLEGVKVGPSPDWVKKKLESVGARSVNNVVDATNLVLFELGQPVHAYDADLIQGKKLSVRKSAAGETIPLLDGSSVSLLGFELVVADQNRAVALAGVMGGGNSEISEKSSKVFLEIAEFNASLVRRSGTKHQKRSESSHRFERGVDPQGQERAAKRLVWLVQKLAGGTVNGAIKVGGPNAAARSIETSAEFVNGFLGTSLASDQIESMITAQGCKIEKSGAKLRVTPPSYRLDLNIPQDLAEEVARTVGYDQIPSTLPALSSQPKPQATGSQAALMLLDRAKDALADLGLCETVNLGFTSASKLNQLGIKPKIKVQNPLSEEHEWMVPSLLPGILQNVQETARRHFGSEPCAIRLFEIRPTFDGQTGAVKAEGEMKTNVTEKWRLALALSGPKLAQGLKKDMESVDFFDLKAVFESLFETMGARGMRFSLPRTPTSETFHLYHPGQCVEVLAGNQSAGYFGQLHPKLAKELKLRETLWWGEIDWSMLEKFSRQAGLSRAFKAPAPFPPMERDFALIVDSKLESEKITSIATKLGKPLVQWARVFDVYQGAQVAEGKTSVAVRVLFQEPTRSLKEDEVEALSQKILDGWKRELGAELRS